MCRVLCAVCCVTLLQFTDLEQTRRFTLEDLKAIAEHFPEIQRQPAWQAACVRKMYRAAAKAAATAAAATAATAIAGAAGPAPDEVAAGGATAGAGGATAAACGDDGCGLSAATASLGQRQALCDLVEQFTEELWSKVCLPLFLSVKFFCLIVFLPDQPFFSLIVFASVAHRRHGSDL